MDIRIVCVVLKFQREKTTFFELVAITDFDLKRHVSEPHNFRIVSLQIKIGEYTRRILKNVAFCYFIGPKIVDLNHLAIF